MLLTYLFGPESTLIEAAEYAAKNGCAIVQKNGVLWLEW